MSDRKRVGILISGSGSNMVALVRAMRAESFPASAALVLSNWPDAGGLAKASELGVPTAVVDHRDFRGNREGFDAAVDRQLRDAGVDLVAAAGFMRVLGKAFVAGWEGRALNIHPSLLPLFPGLDTHARALEAGVAIHGCTVHEMTAELDGGPILGQAAVPVLAGDTPEILAARVLVQEHRLYPAVLSAYARDAAAARKSPVALLSGEG